MKNLLLICLSLVACVVDSPVQYVKADQEQRIGVESREHRTLDVLGLRELDEDSFTAAARITRELKEAALKEDSVHVSVSNHDMLGIMIMFRCSSPDQQCVARAADHFRRWHGVTLVIFGTVSKVGSEYNASISMYDNMSGAVAQKTVSFRRPEEFDSRKTLEVLLEELFGE